MEINRLAHVFLMAQLIDIVNLCPVARAECGNSVPTA
mgnify:CR=1 FL=1